MNHVLRLSTICDETRSEICCAPFVLQGKPRRIVAATNGHALVLLETTEPATYTRRHATLSKQVLRNCRKAGARHRIRIDRLVKFCAKRSGTTARPAHIGELVFDRRLLARCLWALDWRVGEAVLVLSKRSMDAIRIVGAGREIVMMPMRWPVRRAARLPENVYVKRGKVTP